MINIEYGAKVSGSFEIKVVRNGAVIKKLDRNNNLILSNQMASIWVLGTYLHVGSGSTPPTFSDTSLVNWVAAKQSTGGWSEVSSSLVGDNYEREDKRDHQFNVGAVIGNISELGLSSTISQSTALDTRALLKDEVGDPTTISLGALDQLVVTYFIKKQINMLPNTTSSLLNGVAIDYTIRPCISVNGKAGSKAIYPSSIYLDTSGMYMTVNNTNRVSIDPITYLPTALTSSGERTEVGGYNITLTATGSEIIHTFTMPINLGNFQWSCATFATSNRLEPIYVLFQIEFNGPNYITKLDTEIVTFRLKEILSQVI